jgi:hypothetical protein
MAMERPGCLQAAFSNTRKAEGPTQTPPTSCMTTLTLAAGVDPRAMLLELRTLLSVA